MLDIKWIRENSEEFDNSMKSRKCNYNSKELIALDEERRQIITVVQQLQKAKNIKTEAFAKIKDKFSYEFEQAKRDVNDISIKIAELESRVKNNDKLGNYIANIPNIPAKDVPIGNESFNKQIRSWGKVPNFNFQPKQHFDLGEKLLMIDFENARKISGSRFVILKKDLAQLERALVNFMIDIHTNHFGYEELSVPHIVKDDAMYNVGQLPKMSDDSFKVENKRLIPTAEVPITNLVADTILKLENLPLRYVAKSLCFRSEAGSAGKDTKGMMRVHEFTKVELVTICAQDQSETEHEKLTESAEFILQKLGLHYRVMLLSSQDMGFSANKTYDLEVWLPGQNQYREISSCSNFGNFQSRRMKARYRSKDNKESIFLHTVNGSGLAIGRTIIAILENYQNEDGSITVPEALRSYMNGKEIIAN